MTSKTILSTQRTLLERISVDDAPFFLELMNSPGWLRFIGDRAVADVSAAEQVICDSYLKSYREHDFGYYVIRELTESQPIGICGFLKKQTLENPDFGFALLPGYERQGFAEEACRAALKFGQQTFAFPVLDAVTRPDNLKSIRLLEKLGFSFCGVIDDDSERELSLYRLTRQT